MLSMYIRFPQCDDYHCVVVGFKSNTYGFNKPYVFKIEAICAGYSSSFIGANVVFGFGHTPSEYPSRSIHGLVTDIVSQPLSDNHLHLTIQLESFLFPLSFAWHNRTWTNCCVIDIIKTLLSAPDTHHHPIAYQCDLRHAQTKQALNIQYQLSDLEYLLSIARNNDLFFTDQQQATGMHWLFFDDVHCSALQTVSNVTLPFVPYSGLNRSHQTVFDIQIVCHAHQNRRIIFKSDCPHLQAGQCVTLIEHPIPSFNQTYRIIRLAHAADQSGYLNRCLAYPVDQPIHVKSKPITCSLHMPAIITNPSGQNPDIDDTGGYTIRLHFDQNHNDIPGIRLMQPYGGPVQSAPIGMHFPLRANTEVVIGFEKADIHRPIILGTLNTDPNSALVNDHNSSHYRLRTHAGCEFCLNDKPNHESIAIHTSQYQQQFYAGIINHRPTLSLSNRSGGIDIYANGYTQSHHSGNYYLQAQQCKLQVGCGQTTITKDGNIVFSSGQSICVQANVLKMTSKQGDTQLFSANLLSWKTRYTFSCQTEQDIFVIRAENDIMMQSREINLLGETNLKLGKAISLKNGNFIGSQLILAAPEIIKTM